MPNHFQISSRYGHVLPNGRLFSENKFKGLQQIPHYKLLCLSQFLPKTSRQPLPLLQSQFFPLLILPCLSLHISFGSCYFQLLFSSQAYHRKKSQMPFYELCYTDQSPFGLSASIFLCVSLLGCLGVGGIPG